MKPLVFNPVAVADLEEIFEYIKEADEDAAKRVVAGILETAELLRKFPNLGTLSNHRPVRFRGIRFIPVRRYRTYLVFYRENECDLEVLRVLHAARDWKRFFL